MAGRTHSPGARGRGRRDRRRDDAHRLGLGVERDVDVVVASSSSGRRRSSRRPRSSGTAGTRRPSRHVVASPVVGDDRRTACPCHSDAGGATRRASRRRAAHVRPTASETPGRDEDGHEHDGDEQHGGAGRAEPGVQRAARRRRRDSRRRPAARASAESRGAPLASSARPQTPSRPSTVPTARRHGSAPSTSSSSSLRAPAVEQQRQAGAGGDQREQDAGPAGEQRQPGVGAVTDRPELLAPQRQRQQDAQRDQPDGPQVPGLDAPERRSATGCGPAWSGRPASWRRRGGRTRRGAAAGLGHHSEAEITA